MTFRACVAAAAAAARAPAMLTFIRPTAACCAMQPLAGRKQGLAPVRAFVGCGSFTVTRPRC